MLRRMVERLRSERRLARFVGPSVATKAAAEGRRSGRKRRRRRLWRCRWRRRRREDCLRLMSLNLGRGYVAADAICHLKEIRGVHWFDFVSNRAELGSAFAVSLVDGTCQNDYWHFG